MNWTCILYSNMQSWVSGAGTALQYISKVRPWLPFHCKWNEKENAAKYRRFAGEKWGRFYSPTWPDSLPQTEGMYLVEELTFYITKVSQVTWGRSGNQIWGRWTLNIWFTYFWVRLKSEQHPPKGTHRYRQNLEWTEICVENLTN